MRQRNHLLALALLALFAASGVWYFRVYVEPKPFGIVLFTGEGLVPSRLTAARLYDGGADRRLAINSLPSVALLSTHAADFAVPDAAAAASALACGAKVNNRALSTDPAGHSLPTLLELARRRGRAVGLVTNGQLTDPAPAAFYAHAADARDHAPLAAALAEKANLDVILGGGGGDFLPVATGGRRHDGRDLVREMTSQGKYTLLRGRADLQAVQPWRGPRLLGLFGPDALAFRDGLPTEKEAQPSLAEMVGTAIETLQRRAGGYLLVVDAGLVGRAALDNEAERALRETIELDRAVSVALQYAGAKTLVLVAGGEATGGMMLNGYPLRQDHGVSLVGGTNAQGFPSITWATGPAGPAPVAEGGPPGPPAAPAAFHAPYADNTAEDAIAAGFGPGSDRLRGFVDNTFVFELIRSQL